MNVDRDETMLLKFLAEVNRSRFAHAVVSLSDKSVLGATVELLDVPVHTVVISGLVARARLASVRPAADPGTLPAVAPVQWNR